MLRMLCKTKAYVRTEVLHLQRVLQASGANDKKSLGLFLRGKRRWIMKVARFMEKSKIGARKRHRKYVLQTLSVHFNAAPCKPTKLSTVITHFVAHITKHSSRSHTLTGTASTARLFAHAFGIIVQTPLRTSCPLIWRYVWKVKKPFLF